MDGFEYQEKALEELSRKLGKAGKSIRSKADAWVANQIERAAQEKEIATEVLTSGFNRDILRLSPKDVQFLRDCGVAAE